ncbi:hypothetical protein E8E12_008294 [Didymella heteroderae]|uniref:Uncharacterized protein n=1 Tax=Didymella heteroderae TaxID=1769908 RepID=A0A9P4WSF4_9PLEO|nr:hypothetical protein E8E12_008294 [Didymella heteroderae]
MRTVLLLASTVLLLFPVSVLVFILERISKSLLLEQTGRDWRGGGYLIYLNGPNATDPSPTARTAVNMDINNAPSWAILGVCAAAYIVCALDAFGIWELRKVEGTYGSQRVWAWTASVGNILLFGLCLGIFGWATSVQNSEGWQSYEDVQRQNEEYTRETWACQIERFYPKEGWAGAACGTAKATRFLLLPMAVFALLVLGSLWVIIRQRGGIKWLLGGKGRYAGFDNAYELQQGARQGPYAPAPYAQGPPQWAPQPYYPVQPAQQLGSPPAPSAAPQVQKMGVAADERPVFR